MITQRIFLLFWFVLFTIQVSSQTIKGVVYEYPQNKESKQKEPIPAANVYWLGSTTGTIANEKGEFEITVPDGYPANLVISFIGYQSDTIKFDAYKKSIKVELKSSIALKEFQVAERGSGTYINTIDPLHTETLSSKELTKAACCNISESFETNASVDVNFTDAVSGTRKFKCLVWMEFIRRSN